MVPVFEALRLICVKLFVTLEDIERSIYNVSSVDDITLESTVSSNLDITSTGSRIEIGRATITGIASPAVKS